jgi:hypothetical protein
MVARSTIWNELQAQRSETEILHKLVSKCE